MMAGVWEGSPVPATGQEWLAPRGPKGMGSVWIMGPQGSERGLADSEIQGLELRDKPGPEVWGRDCGIQSEMLRLLGRWNEERGRWVMEPR